MAGLRLSIDPTGMVQGGKVAENALERVQTEAKQTEQALTRTSTRGSAAVRGLGTSIGGLSRATKGGAGGLQNMSYQIGDFAVQVGSGTSATIALGQQLPQLLGGFGALGAVLGAVVAVGIPLGAFLIRSTGNAKDAEEALKGLNSALADYQSAADLAGSSAAELTEKFGSQAEGIRQTLDILQQVALSKALDGLSVAAAQLDTSRIRELVDIVAEGKGEIEAFNDNFNRATAELQDGFGLSAAQAQELLGALDQMSAARGPEQVSSASRELNALLIDVFGTVQDIPPVLREMADTAGQVDVAASAIVGTMEAVESATLNAAAAATILADETARAAAAQASFDKANKQYGGRGGDPRQFSNPENNTFSGSTYTPPKARASRGGGSRKSGASSAAREAEQTAKAYDSLISSLDPLTRATMELADAQETINDALAAGHITAEQAATTFGLAQERFKEASAEAKKVSGVWADFANAGGSALDRLIDGTTSLTDALKDMIKELVAAITKKKLLGSVSGGSASDSLGTLLFKSAFGGFFDSGGMISPGQTGIVGERGPEAVTSTARGTLVTSRVDTARSAKSSAAPVFHIDARGAQEGVAGQIAKALQAYAPVIEGRAVSTVRRNFGNYQAEYQTSGGMV